MSSEPPAKKTALFISHRYFLQPGGGGAQWCTREYRATLAAAGFRLIDVLFNTDNRLRARILRKLRPRPHNNIDAGSIIRAVVQKAASVNASWCFLNNADAASLAHELRIQAPHLRLVFLSHGVELTDVINNLRLAFSVLPAVQKTPVWLGRLLLSEVRQRRALSATICISQSDAEWERWLGTQATLFLHRQIPHNTLIIKPIKGRIGVVSTLDHGPNLHGLELLACALERFPSVCLRVVGGPEKAGRALSQRFPWIHYCGRLDDDAIITEVASWNAFTNPIFCNARGASTKVATALGWGLPVLTTPQGARGYAWDAQTLPLVDTPEALAQLIHHFLTKDEATRWLAAAEQIRKMAPSNTESGLILATFLTSLPR